MKEWRPPGLCLTESVRLAVPCFIYVRLRRRHGHLKFCYCDESGTGAEPIAVMVGVLVDAQRMHCTKQDWAALLTSLSMRAGRTIAEMHTRDFYPGNTPWRQMSGPERREVVGEVCTWLRERKHRLVFTSVQKSAYDDAVARAVMPAELNTPWRFMGFHLILAVQRAHQKEKRHKGHTLFVFDNEERERMRFTDIIQRPQTWSDQYYERRKNQDELDQIVDVPYFADSREVGLLQVADFAAFFLRRYAELQEPQESEKYAGERQQVAEWASMLAQRAIDRRHVYSRSSRNEAAELFWSCAPPSLRDLYH